MKKYNYNYDVFSNENDISYYLLGAFMADGCVRSDKTYIEIVSKDREWIKSINDLISPNNIVNHYQKTNTYTLRICNKKIVQWFIDHGCIPKKSLTLTFPIVPKQYLPDFIRGILDGDGSISLINYYSKKNKKHYTQGSCYICSSSALFITELHNILIINNFKHSFLEIKNSPRTMKSGRVITQKHPHFRIQFFSKNAYEFLNWIYYQNHRISMERKREKTYAVITDYEFKFNTPHPVSKYTYPSDEILLAMVKEVGVRATGLTLNIPRLSIHDRVKRIKAKLTI